MGMCESGHDLAATRTLFLRLCGLCYAMAFVSLYPQIPGLYGQSGILPIHGLVDPTPALRADGSFDFAKLFALAKARPSILWLSPLVNLSPDHVCDILCLVGTALALASALFPRYGNKLAFFLLWTFYQSIYQVGQTFMWFQWDILLLEVGFLCIIVAPYKGSAYYVPRPRDHIAMMLVRWLLFRMMFASGVVKLTSLCPTWWNLTALPTHYESQCLPTPLAWFAYNWLPDFIHKLSVAGTFFIEIPLTFLFFAPTKSLRKFSWAHQIILMVVIMLTGNYNFFNLLFIALCASLMDDSWLKSGRWKLELDRPSWITYIFSKVFNFVAYVTLLGLVCRYIVDVDVKSDGSFNVEPRVKFTRRQFDDFMSISTNVGVILGGLALSFATLISFYKSFCPSNELARMRSSCFAKLKSLFACCFYAIVAFFVYTSSLPVFTQGVGQNMSKQMAELVRVNPYVDVAANLHLVSSYGLFRRMTGVGGRPEVVVEVAETETGPWREVNFRYTPGNVSEAPQFLLPHQPRLDWQMWFAALGDFQHNPWFISLMYRILENKPEVIQLLHPSESSKMAQNPPKFVRSKLYHYHYTTAAVSTGEWWSRDLQYEYSPILGLKANGPELRQYLEKIGVLRPVKAAQISTNGPVVAFLDFLRQQAANVQHHYIVWSTSWILYPILLR